MKHLVFASIFLLALISFTPSHASADTLKIFSHESDMGIRVAPYPGAWADQHDATEGIDQEASQDRALAYTATKESDAGIVAIYRSFMSFDTSGIPDNAEVTSAKLIVFADTVLDAFDDQYSYMNVLRGFQESETNITFDDIEMCGDSLINPTKGGNDVDISTIVQGAYLEIPLSTTGIGWVNASGYTKLCIREGHDIENVEPVNNDGSWKESGISHYTSEAPGTSTDPYLVVTYTVDEEEDPTLAELIQAFRDTVMSYDLPRKVERSYLAQILLLERSVERERYNAAYAQVLVLKLSLVHDKKHKNLSGAEYNELVSQLETIKDLIATYR